MQEYIIQKLTELLIKQDLEDKKNKKITYVSKSSCYRDLIKFFKNNYNSLK